MKLTIDKLLAGEVDPKKITMNDITEFIAAEKLVVTVSSKKKEDWLNAVCDALEARSKAGGGAEPPPEDDEEVPPPTPPADDADDADDDEKEDPPPAENGAAETSGSDWHARRAAQAREIGRSARNIPADGDAEKKSDWLSRRVN